MAEFEQRLLQERAARYRRFASEILDERAHRALIELAAEYEARAAGRMVAQGTDAQKLPDQHTNA